MKAVTIKPGQQNSAGLGDIPTPEPGPGEVRIKTIAVGVDGTDVDINAGLYGEAPPGEERLIIGHEAVGFVEKTGPDVSEFFEGELVVPTVRRGCKERCPSCKRLEPDMCLTNNFQERGIKQLQGYMADYFIEKPDNLLKLPPELREVGILVEPLSICEKGIGEAFKIQERVVWSPEIALVLGAGNIGLLSTFLLRNKGIKTYALDIEPEDSIKANLVRRVGADYINGRNIDILELPGEIGQPDMIIEATGYSKNAFEAMQIIRNDGIVCLLSITTRHEAEEVCGDCVERRLVMGNAAVFGTVSSNRDHFQMAIEHMAEIENKWPDVTHEMITKRVSLTDFAEALNKTAADIKPVVMVAA